MQERLDAWSDRETAALVEYIALFHSSNEDPSSVWPSSKNDEFWGKCADAVNCYNIDKNRTGKLNQKYQTYENYNIVSKFMNLLSHTVGFNILCILFNNFVQVLHAETR